MENKIEKSITVRERLVILLTVFLIKLIKPWEYDHHFDEFWSQIKKISNGGDFHIEEKK